MLGQKEFENTFPTANYYKTSYPSIVMGNDIFVGHSTRYRIQSVYETINGFRTRKLGEIYMSSKTEQWVACVFYSEPIPGIKSMTKLKVLKHYHIAEKMDTIEIFAKALKKEEKKLQVSE